MLEEFKNKPVLILGFGREGQDSFLFLSKKFPKQVIGIADQKEKISPLFHGRGKQVIWHLGRNYLKALKRYDVIIKSPGIPPRIIAPFLTKRQKVTSQTEIFFENCPGTIIGVTGTKGKSTTATLIYEVLKSGGVNARLVGNIEQPALQFLEKATKGDVFIYELSSFQLETITRSPRIAVFLNLHPEHLDHHGTFKSYANAKANITRFQSKEDYLIFNEADPNVRKIAAKSRGQKIPFTPLKRKNAGFLASPEPAVIIGKLFSIPKEKIRETIKNFKTLPHRLERVGEWKGITFYNDSLATIPEATIGAIDMLGSQVHTLVSGGFDRGIKFGHLAQKILKSNVKTLILFPTTGELIWKEIEKLNKKHASRRTPQHFFLNNMATAVELCYQNTLKGKICLLSPASSSFNLFRDYKDRGEQFKKFVKFYGKKKRS